MNYENQQSNPQFRRFLLGEMLEEERSKFEEEFILDEEKFADLQVAEDELIEQYIRGTLDASEKAKFEAHFLSTEKRRARVEFTRQMLANLKSAQIVEVKKTTLESENPSVFAVIAAFLKQPGFALGTAFAVLLLAFGGWFFWRNSFPPIDVAVNTPTPTPSPQISITPTPQVVENKNSEPVFKPAPTPNKNAGQNNQRPKIETEPSKKPENTNQKDSVEKPVKTPLAPTITTLALFTGGVRGDGKTNELNLPKNSGGANLQLNLESQDYKNYRAEIVDQNGSVVYRSGRLSANKSKVYIFVAPQKLKHGDYIIRLYGKNAQNQDESAADFQFRVNQK